jgi:hypothetical protein
VCTEVLRGVQRAEVLLEILVLLLEKKILLEGEVLVVVM